MITVEIIYALPEKQTLITFHTLENSSIQNVLEQSHFLDSFPELSFEKLNVGIFSKRCELSHILKNGDRIEIYRPLLQDPKDARRQRVKK